MEQRSDLNVLVFSTTGRRTLMSYSSMTYEWSNYMGVRSDLARSLAFYFLRRMGGGRLIPYSSMTYEWNGRKMEPFVTASLSLANLEKERVHLIMLEN
eukprot:4904488-Pleurochrysis_carterae.AAC.1